MKKQIKKGKAFGFTLTELVIVIVIIAILAAILIPTYTGYVNRAKDTSDTFTVKQLNDLLINFENDPDYKHDTLGDVLYMLEENGFNATNLQTKYFKNTLVWNQDTNRFYILNDDGNIESRDANAVPEDKADYTYWLLYTGDSSNATLYYNTDAKQHEMLSKYSVYLAVDLDLDEITICRGLELGDNDITNITYYNECQGYENDHICDDFREKYDGDDYNASGTVIIKTNSKMQTLTIAGYDVIHYGDVGIVNLIAPDGTYNYFENGTAIYIDDAGANVVAEAGSSIDYILLDYGMNSYVEPEYDEEGNETGELIYSDFPNFHNNGGEANVYALTDQIAKLNANNVKIEESNILVSGIDDDFVPDGSNDDVESKLENGRNKFLTIAKSEQNYMAEKEKYENGEISKQEYYNAAKAYLDYGTCKNSEGATDYDYYCDFNKGNTSQIAIVKSINITLLNSGSVFLNQEIKGYENSSSDYLPGNFQIGKIDCEGKSLFGEDTSKVTYVLLSDEIEYISEGAFAGAQINGTLYVDGDGSKMSILQEALNEAGHKGSDITKIKYTGTEEYWLEYNYLGHGQWCLVSADGQ